MFRRQRFGQADQRSTDRPPSSQDTEDLKPMTKPAKPEREEERLAELHRYRILDTDPEQAYDDLRTLVAGICGTPMGAVTLIAGDRQWFKARHGIEMTETPRDVAFCAHAILEPDKLLHVRDSQ